MRFPKPMVSRSLRSCVLSVTCAVLVNATSWAAEKKTPAQVLFTNVNIFDGKGDKLAMGMSVLIEGNLIKQISRGGIKSNRLAKVIDGGGRTLMPGLIDGHAHVMINDDYGAIERDRTLVDLAINGVVVMERFLMDGFTAVRDMGGPTFALGRAIDSGKILGPRMYHSGPFISQTSGHGDFRDRADAGYTNRIPGDISNFERFGIGTVADGVPAVLAAARLNLRNGATQIKIMAGGGGSSRFDPWKVSYAKPGDWGSTTPETFQYNCTRRASARAR